MKGFFLSFFTFGLCACSTIDSIDDPAHWVGRPVTELVAAWGEPNDHINDSMSPEILIFKRSIQIDLITGLKTIDPIHPFRNGRDFVQTSEQFETEETIIFTINSDGFISETN